MVSRAVELDKPRIGLKVPSEQKMVKSADRVLEILEYFDDVKRASTVMRIAQTLGYPQSSTSALLRSLVARGYLNYDRYNRTYVTSGRVALLGSWVNSDIVTEGTIMSLMKEINERTGDTVMLATRNGLHVQYIHVVQATSPARLHMTLGTVRPLASSGAGHALMSTMPDAEVTRLVMRINAEREEGRPPIVVRDLLDRLAEIRRKGYAFTCNLVTPGGGIIAKQLPSATGQPPMILGIGGISEVMRTREAELAEILCNAVASYRNGRGRNIVHFPEGGRAPLGAHAAATARS